ncbi:hypothetical protein HY572_05275 [Candidatus Micrarchaeota archaeon]|nr:hypothetical protein [Candidatus Micrarchaeota archaeon]
MLDLRLSEIVRRHPDWMPKPYAWTKGKKGGLQSGNYYHAMPDHPAAPIGFEMQVPQQQPRNAEFYVTLHDPQFKQVIQVGYRHQTDEYLVVDFREGRRRFTSVAPKHPEAVALRRLFLQAIDQGILRATPRTLERIASGRKPKLARSIQAIRTRFQAHEES